MQADSSRASRNFYPRPPRGGRLSYFIKKVKSFFISIHALREEGDPRQKNRLKKVRYFYPRPPRGGRPGIRPHLQRMVQFLSTPSARRATSAFLVPADFDQDFYPRPPRGGRRYTPTRRRMCHAFLSTPSARRATRSFELSVKLSDISIHALREEGDVQRQYVHKKL